MDFSGDSPGISLRRLYSLCSPEQLSKLIDPLFLDLIRSIDPSFLDSGNFPSLCSKLISPRILLESNKTRSLVFQFLPKEKAIELLVRLGLSPKKHDIERQFNGIDFNTGDYLIKLFDFFGVQDEDRAAQPIEQEIEPCNSDYALFTHQRDVAKRVELVLEEFPHKTLLHMPTGSGKTRTAMDIVARHLVKREKTLVCWLAHSAELLEQAAQEFKQAWRHIGNRELSIFRFWGPYTPSLADARDGILITGFAKLYSLYKRDANMLMVLGDRTSLTVVDEAHQSIAPTFRSLILGLHTKRPSSQLLGLSATPGRTWNDIAADVELSDFFGTKKVTLQIEGYPDPVAYLLEKGYLAKPHFRLIECVSDLSIDSSNEDTGADYSESVLESLALDQQRNRKILKEAELLLAHHKRIILFATSVNHAKLISAVLSSKGFDSEVITGETPLGERERIIRKFKGSDPAHKIICNFGVLTAGFDAPCTSATIIARPTRSLVLYSQMVGRAIRGPRQGGNENAEIVTVVDPNLPGFGNIAQAFMNWEDVWAEQNHKGDARNE